MHCILKKSKMRYNHWINFLFHLLLFSNRGHWSDMEKYTSPLILETQSTEKILFRCDTRHMSTNSVRMFLKEQQQQQRAYYWHRGGNLAWLGIMTWPKFKTRAMFCKIVHELPSRTRLLSSTVAGRGPWLRAFHSVVYRMSSISEYFTHSFRPG